MNTMRLGDLKVNTTFMWKTLLCRKVSSNSWTYCVVDGQEFMLPSSTIVEVETPTTLVKFAEILPGTRFISNGVNYVKTISDKKGINAILIDPAVTKFVDDHFRRIFDENDKVEVCE